MMPSPPPRTMPSMSWPELLQRLSAWAAHGWHPGHTMELIPLLAPYLAVLLADTREWLSILIMRLRTVVK